MTGEEMVNEFQQLLNAVSDKFMDEERLPTYEIYDYLNRTVERYIKLKYLSGENFKANAFKVSQSPDDLALLIANYEVDPVSITAYPGIDYSAYIKLPDDFLAYSRSYTKITRTKPTSLAHTEAKIPNVEIDFNDIDGLITTPYNSPILLNPVATLTNDNLDFDGGKVPETSLLVITDKYCTIVGITIDYIRKPGPINQYGDACQLAPYLHEEIVKLAVSLFLDEYKLKLAQSK